MLNFCVDRLSCFEVLTRPIFLQCYTVKRLKPARARHLLNHCVDVNSAFRQNQDDSYSGIATLAALRPCIAVEQKFNTN